MRTARKAEAVHEDLRILPAYIIDPTQPNADHGKNCLRFIINIARSVTTIFPAVQVLTAGHGFALTLDLAHSQNCQQAQHSLRGHVFEGDDHALRMPARTREFEHDVELAELVGGLVEPPLPASSIAGGSPGFN